MAKMSSPDKQVGLQFDQYSRQVIVRDLIGQLYGKKKIKVLDVGGYLGNTQKFLPDAQVTVLDVYEVNDKNYVKGSALDIPFDDESFDAVVTFDVFEHIPESDRMRFVQEMERVSKDIVSIAAPFNTDLVAEAEKKIDDLHKKLYKKPHPWLVEHIQYGLPNLKKTVDALNRSNVKFEIYESNNIYSWKLMMSFMMMCGDSRLSKLSAKVNRFYNQHQGELGDSRGPSYRKILFGRKYNTAKTLFPAISDSYDPLVYSQFIDILTDAHYQLLQDKALSIAQASAHEMKEVSDAYDQRIEALQGELSNLWNKKIVRLTSRIKRTATRK